MDMFLVLLKLIGFLIGFSAFIFILYITTRFIADKTGKAMQGKFIEVVESVNLGIDKQLFLVKVGGNFFLISSSGKNVQLMSTVEISNYEELRNEKVIAGDNVDFKAIFEKYLGVLKNAKDEISSKVFVKDSEETKFKSNLAKLRTINVINSDRAKKFGDDVTNENKI